MTKRHFVAIAAILRGYICPLEDECDDCFRLIADFVDFFEGENPRFDSAKFRAAVTEGL